MPETEMRMKLPLSHGQDRKGAYVIDAKSFIAARCESWRDAETFAEAVNGAPTRREGGQRDTYGRIDTLEMLQTLEPVIFERNEAASLVHKLVALAEAADLYAAAPGPERLALLNECIDALPQRAQRARV